MKKLLVFIIIILLIMIVAFPTLFAEEATIADIQTSNIDAEILSNMDNYMKLNSPKSIDKTDKYLVVANNTRIFVQPQAGKKDFYYKDLITSSDELITKIVITDDNWVVALVKYDNDRHSRLILLNANDGKFYAINQDGIYSIAKYNNKFTAIYNSELVSYNIVNNNIQELETYQSGLGTIDMSTLKIFDNTPYYFARNTKILQKCKIDSNNHCTTTDSTIPITGIEIKDYYIYNDRAYYIDTTNKLYANDKEIAVDNTKFNQLLIENGNIIATAETSDTVDNGKVYTFDTNGTELNLITSKGSDKLRFDSPQGVFSDGEYLYIADTNNSRIIKRKSVETTEREEIKTTHKPIKVVVVAGQIYYISNDKILYKSKNDKNSPDEEKLTDVVSISPYDNNLLILSNNVVYTLDGNSTKTFIQNIAINNANEITTAVSTNYAYLINKSTGDIAKYNLEKPENAVFTSKIPQIGRNYNIDFRGNLFVENNGIITKYSQTMTSNVYSFTKVGEYKINKYDTSSNISTAVDSINANYYFTNIDEHLLYKIDGKSIALDGTINNEITPPSYFEIIKTGKVKVDTLAYRTPNNPESTRMIKSGEIFLILSQTTEEFDDKKYYYVISEYAMQYEYIATDELDIMNTIDMHEQVMSSIVGNMQVYKYPYKNAETKFDGKEYILDSKTQVTCIEKIADGDIWNWYKIRFESNGKTIVGYVNADYLSKVVPTTPPKTIKFMRAKAPKVGTTIKVYKEADLNSEVLFDDIKDGDDIQIVGEFDAKSTFTKVYYNNTIGYILSENLQATGLTPNQIIAITITSVAIVAFTIIALLLIHKNKYSKKKIEETQVDILG